MTNNTKKFKDFAEDLNPEYATYLVGYKPTTEEEIRIPLALIGLGGSAEGKYIRKDSDDYANGNISFRQGIDISGNIRSTEYIQNARGWFGDHKGNFEMNSLRLREFLETPELRKNRITVMQNEFWFTDSATVSNAVLRTDGKYNIDFKLEEGEYVPFRAGDILKGIFNYDTGFYTVFLHVDELTYPQGDGAKSVVATSMNGRPPAKAMLLARMNNSADPDRQGSMFVDGLHGYMRIIQGFNEADPTAQGDFTSMRVQLGRLDNIKGHPAFGDLLGWGLYAENVYLTGRLVQTDWKGEQHQPLLYFKGLYSSIEIYYPYDSVRYVDELGKEGIYYVKLRDDILISGITGILPTNTDYWEMNQLGANGIDGRSLWSTYNDSIAKPSKPASSQGTDNGWHIQPTTASMWMCQKIARTIEEGMWSDPIKIGALDGINSDWKTYVFKMSETVPATPNSGVDTKPIPDGWQDAPTDTIGKWWMIVATVDGTTGRVNSPWSSPKQVTGDKGEVGESGEYTVYQFAKKIGEVPPDPAMVTWYDNPPALTTGEFLFMRMQVIIPTISTIPDPTKWSVPVRISGEKGEPGVDGIDGDYTEFIYCRSIFNAEVASSATPGSAAIAKDLITDPNLGYPAGGGNPTGSVNEPGYVPGGWSADPISVNESLQLGWIAKRYKVGNTWGRFATPAINAKYGVDGTDGPGTEYIFFRYTSPLTLSQFNPNASTLPNKDQDGFVPTDIGIGQGQDRIVWTDNPTGVTDIWLYEYTSKRTKTNGKWSAFTTPALWSKFGQNGMDGSGVEMVFRLTAEKVNPGKPLTNSQDDGFVPANWINNASGANKQQKYEWMAKRRKLNNLWLDWEMPVVWSTYVIGDWISYAFKASSALPVTPTDKTIIPIGWSDSPEIKQEGDKTLPNWLTKAAIDGTSSVAGTWSKPVKVTGEDGEIGEDGTAVDYKYARNASTTSYPSITRTQLNPTGWTDTPPTVTSGYYVWMTVARKSADGTKLLPQNGETVAQWAIPVRISGETGPQGPQGGQGNTGGQGPEGPRGPDGATGPGLAYRGVYDKSKIYYWKNGVRDVVKYPNATGSYYAADRDTITEGWSSGEWALLNSFSNVATDVLLAQDAEIAGWKFSTNYIWAPGNTVLLDGRVNPVSNYHLAIGANAATDPKNAPFRVSITGKMWASGCEINNASFANININTLTAVNATINSGTIGGLNINSNSISGDKVIVAKSLISNIENSNNTFRAGIDSSWNSMLYVSAGPGNSSATYSTLYSAATFVNTLDRNSYIPLSVYAKYGRVYSFDGMFDWSYMQFQPNATVNVIPIGRKSSNSQGDGLRIFLYSASYTDVILPSKQVILDAISRTSATGIMFKLEITTSNWGVGAYRIAAPPGATLYDQSGNPYASINFNKNISRSIMCVITDEFKYYLQ